MDWKNIPGPQDTIAGLSFGPGHTLAGVSWDGHLKTWDCDTSEDFNVATSTPLFAVCWEKRGLSQICVGGASRRISVVDSKTCRVRDVGIDHTAAVSSLVSDNFSGAIIAGSYDGSIELLDLRVEKSVTHETPDKILDIDINRDYQLVAACSGCRVRIYDTRKMQHPLETRQVHGSYPLRRVRCMPNGKGYVVTNIKSRVIVEYFEDDSKNFVFRSNRTHGSQGWQAHSLNALAFDPKSVNQLLVGGSDKKVLLWDLHQRKLVSRYQFPQSITALAFSNDGECMACGISDDSWRLAPTKAAENSPSQLLWKKTDILTN